MSDIGADATAFVVAFGLAHAIFDYVSSETRWGAQMSGRALRMWVRRIARKHNPGALVAFSGEIVEYEGGIDIGTVTVTLPERP